MAISRRLGWVRLGIVLSVLWVAGASMYLVNDWRLAIANPIEALHADPIWQNCEPIPQTLRPAELGLGEAAELPPGTVFEAEVGCRPNWAKSLLLVFGPLLAAWIVIASLLWTIGWVGRGFSPKIEE